MSAAAPFIRGAGLHLTSRECTVRARSRAYLSAAPVLSLKRRTQKTAWRCGAHGASQDNEATPRGRPADRTATCTPRVERGGERKSRATGLMSVRPIGGARWWGKRRREGRIRARSRRKVWEQREEGAPLCCRHVRQPCLLPPPHRRCFLRSSGGGIARSRRPRTRDAAVVSCYRVQTKWLFQSVFPLRTSFTSRFSKIPQNIKIFGIFE